MVRHIALVAFLALLTSTAGAKEPIFSTGDGAIRGYDPVAYFEQGKPVHGSSDLTHQWNGATWRFANAANRAAFEKDPERYAPRYGGYCAWAVANGYTASTDPDAWAIVDGRLYLNYSADIQRRWRKDVAGNIEMGDRNWPDVLNR